MASSGAMTAQTFSSIIRQSLETGIEPCKKEIPSNLRSFKALKVPRPPTSQRPASETVSDYLAGRDAPSAGLFILERHEVEEVKEVNEIKKIQSGPLSRALDANLRACFLCSFTSFTPLPPLPPFSSSVRAYNSYLWTTNRLHEYCAKQRNSWKLMARLLGAIAATKRPRN